VSQPVPVAALQCSLNDTWQVNTDRVEALIRQAAGDGARVILPPELFGGPYFCREERGDFFAFAEPADGRTVTRFAKL